MTSVGETNHQKVDERPSFKRNDASGKEELWDYQEDEEPVVRTPALKASPEALGVWKRAQKMLAEACEEMARHRQKTESYWPQGKGPQAQGKAWDEDVDKSKGHEDRKMSDKTGGETEAGCDDQCFRCGGLHRTSQCPAPGDHKISSPTDQPEESGMTFDEISFVAAGGAEDGGNPDDEDTRILAKEQSEVGEAFVDCGAAESIGGAKALELLGKLIGPEQIQIDQDDRPWFICEDGSRQQVMSKVTFHMTAGWRTGKGDFYVLEAPPG